MPCAKHLYKGTIIVRRTDYGFYGNLPMPEKRSLIWQNFLWDPAYADPRRCIERHCQTPQPFSIIGFKSISATDNSCGVSDTDVDPFPHIRSCLGPEHVFPIVSVKSIPSSTPSSRKVFKNAGRPGRPGLSPMITLQFWRKASTAR
mmetsp:Transcript_20062/g.42304  ORF Transcript_20062/g.42304 Transcript_20062/m.42304 type:complete len:146 (+) Transcript_20062:3281-3718(+)